ncbi:hypothetical protein SAMN05421874_1554 [Nonomuraea maritima]|uniref:Transglycosylase SLT domain-containing protein n=1 Tax=Nonomuraea maritima TaxID=683260 RepID=A0A1G9SBX1_9ACTN|nr:hypothetical protein [Nonomuraea maritima]SDM32929.1 hypothetical protein SAMN05421874_1554 [Nonomuraea maritima]
MAGRFFSVRLRFSRGVVAIAVIVVVLAVAVSIGLVLLLRKAPVVMQAPYCTVDTPEGARTLDPEQAEISATIAAVAARRKLPERAVVIAYATALQESKLLNLPDGDRDSVGVFQQRESQGWGTKKQIMDPVYATNKFFAELVKVKNYRKLPLAEAAQAVQRSAGGYAYAPHETEAKILAAAFTGRVPQAVHCWYPQKATPAPSPRTAAARKELARALGSTAITTRKRGWLVAAWSVAHAGRYGLSEVAYNGATWSNNAESVGWKAGGKAGARRVELS